MPSDPHQRFCLDCQYDLTGLEEHRCPECGRAFDPDHAQNWLTDRELATWQQCLRKLAISLGVLVGGVLCHVTLSSFMDPVSGTVLSMILLLFPMGWGLVASIWLTGRGINWAWRLAGFLLQTTYTVIFLVYLIGFMWLFQSL